MFTAREHPETINNLQGGTVKCTNASIKKRYKHHFWKSLHLSNSLILLVLCSII